MTPSFPSRQIGAFGKNTVSRCRPDNTEFGRPPPSPCVRQSHCLDVDGGVLEAEFDNRFRKYSAAHFSWLGRAGIW